MDIYLRATGSTQFPKDVQTATIINRGGENLLRNYDHSVWENEEDKDNPASIQKVIQEEMR